MYFFVNSFFDHSKEKNGNRHALLVCERRELMITVNGEEEKTEIPVTVREYLEQKNYRTDRIAVERNGEIVPKSRYGDTVLQDGDCLEIVSFVGGG